MKITLACLLLLSCVARLSAVYHENQTCRQIMKDNGLTERFPGAAAHGIHSITLEDLRYFFKPDATEVNNVPTVNYDLSENASLILPHAKLYGYDTSFKTISMRHLDQVLRDMDKKDWYMTNYNTLEKVAHVIHMNELWARIKVHYDAISLLGYNKDLCHCVKDTQGNGILKMLPLLALKIRYPGITSGTSCKLGRCRRSGGSGGPPMELNYIIHTYMTPELKSIDFDEPLERVRRRVSTELVDGDAGTKHLDGEDGWSYWKSGMRKMIQYDSYECAMFLYCVLNE